MDNLDVVPRMFVTGDTHGEKARFYYDGFANNRLLGKGDYLFVCGDFGYVFNGSSQEETYLDKLSKDKPYMICFVDGNHENFSKLSTYLEEIWCGGRVHVIRRDEEGNPKIIHLMRGQVFGIDDVRIFTFGGAYSIDKMYRTEGKSWWKEEMPSEDEKIEGVKNLESHSSTVDVILTHTAPRDTMERFRYRTIEEAGLNDYLEYVRENTKYSKWYFGHLHKDEEIWRNQYAIYFYVRDLRTGKVLSDFAPGSGSAIY